MIVKKIEEADHAEIGRIFSSHGINDFDKVASDLGIAVCDNRKILGCAYLYKTNSPVSIIDMFAVNKGIKRDDRAKVIDILLHGLINLSKALGFSYISADPRFKRSYERLRSVGFTEKGPGHFWMEINHG